MKYPEEDFEGNIKVTVSEHEVRLWVCNKTGENIFRFKAIGQIYRAGNDITVMPKTDFMET